MKVYPFFVCKEDLSCASLSALQLLCAHLLEKGLLWPVTVLVLWMGTKALISIHLCFTVVSSLEFPYPTMYALCYFKCVVTCSSKGLFQESTLMSVAHCNISRWHSTKHS